MRTVLGDLVFGVDENTMDSVIWRMLGERNLSLTVAESLTWGTFELFLDERPRPRVGVLRGDRCSL